MNLSGRTLFQFSHITDSSSSLKFGTASFSRFGRRNFSPRQLGGKKLMNWRKMFHVTPSLLPYGLTSGKESQINARIPVINVSFGSGEKNGKISDFGHITQKFPLIHESAIAKFMKEFPKVRKLCTQIMLWRTVCFPTPLIGCFANVVGQHCPRVTWQIDQRKQPCWQFHSSKLGETLPHTLLIFAPSESLRSWSQELVIVLNLFKSTWVALSYLDSIVVVRGTKQLLDGFAALRCTSHPRKLGHFSSVKHFSLSFELWDLKTGHGIGIEAVSQRTIDNPCK